MSHRKIDVDALDEDQFLDDDELALAAAQSTGEDGSSSGVKANITNISPQLPRNPAELDREVSDRVVEVRGLLSKADYKTALHVALQNPPIGRDPQSAKDKITQAIMDVLSSVKSTEIPALVKTLNENQLDLLMKYVFKGMAAPEKFNSSTLLQWHEKVTEVGGVGCIVRVLTDRKTV